MAGTFGAKTSFALLPGHGEESEGVPVGLLSVVEAFQAEMGAYFNDQKPLPGFEKYRWRRVMFDPVEWRLAEASQPSADSPDVQ